MADASWEELQRVLFLMVNLHIDYAFITISHSNFITQDMCMEISIWVLKDGKHLVVEAFG